MELCFTNSFTVIYIDRPRRQRKSQNQTLLCKTKFHMLCAYNLDLPPEVGRHTYQPSVSTTL